MSDLPVIPLVDEGLGNSAYLVDLGDGRALAVDPSRDLRSVHAAAASRGLRIVFSAETHLHADFLSGSVQLAADGAQVLASATGGRTFPHRGLGEGEEVDLGGLTLRALTTPGHTPEHLSYLLLDGTTPLGVFTGGSLLVGAAARTDLVGAEHTEELARAQYRSLRRLSHPARRNGGVPHPRSRVVLLRAARRRAHHHDRCAEGHQPLPRAADEDTFVRLLLSSLGTYPAYFDRLGEVNRRGPALIEPNPALAALSPIDVQALRGSGAEIIDVRPYDAYAAGHIPGSLSITLRGVFATWLGWLVPSPATPLVIVRDPDQDPDEVVWQALKIGYDRLAGELSGGLAAWTAVGLPVASTRVSGLAATDPAAVVDVRQAAEFAAGHLPGAANVELGGLAARSAGLSGRGVVVMCGHGERAATAASVLERSGVADAAMLIGGPQDWANAAAGRAVQVDA